MTTYLDCNATTPVEPQVAEAMAKYVTGEFGNAGSRTHDYGARAKKAVERTRQSVVETVRDDTLLVSMMQVNNEAGVRQLARPVSHRRKSATAMCWRPWTPPSGRFGCPTEEPDWDKIAEVVEGLRG